MKKRFPKRTPAEKARSLELRARALRRLEELKRRDIQRAAERRAFVKPNGPDRLTVRPASDRSRWGRAGTGGRL